MDPVPPDRPRLRRPRTRTIVLSAVLAVLVAGGAVAAWGVTTGPGAEPATPSPAPPAATAQVIVGTITTSTNLSGDLRYAATGALTARSSGTLTSLPVGGSTPATGDVLYRIDTAPTVLLSGSFPVWRDLGPGMKGDDVLQLEQSLANLGYFSREPDTEWLDPTTVAVKKWQEALGVPETGTVAASSIVFAPGTVRIGAVSAALGSAVGPGTKVADLTASAPSVQVKVPLEDQAMAALGAAVTIGVPDGSSIAGTVAALGLPEAASSGQQPGAEPKRVVPVEISLADTGSIGALQEATVSVGFVGEKHENVLTVPVDALLAQPGGGFAVEVVGDRSTRSTVPVTVGLYQDAVVEVAGDGLAEGTTVVTAP